MGFDIEILLKEIVWEHNTHVGNARATNIPKAGMINIGQLAREKYGRKNVKKIPEINLFEL